MDPSKTRDVGEVAGCGRDLALGEELSLSLSLSGLGGGALLGFCGARKKTGSAD